MRSTREARTLSRTGRATARRSTPEEQRDGLGPAQADVRAAHLELDDVSEGDAPHEADVGAGQEAELHQPAPEGAFAADGSERGALAGTQLIERSGHDGP